MKSGNTESNNDPMFGRNKEPDRLAWAYGRLVALRPDVPGKRFHPEDAYVLTTPRRKELAAAALRDIYDHERGKAPEWLAEPASKPPGVDKLLRDTGIGDMFSIDK